MHYIPAWSFIVITCMVFVLGNLLTYTIGVTQGHFRPVFPYISDTGAIPLENGFFVLVYSLTALFALIVCYIRYKDTYTQVESLCFRIFNLVVFVVGVLALFFLVAVAAFEFDDSEASSNIHFASAVLAIFLEYVFSFGQIVIGVMLPPKGVWWKWLIMCIQLVITVMGILLFFYFFGMSYHPALSFYRAQIDNTTAIASNTGLMEYYYFGLSIDYSRAVVEWIIFAELIGFYLTLIPDFSRIRVKLVVERPYDTPPKEVKTQGGSQLQSL